MEGSSPALVVHCPTSQTARGQSFLTVRAAPVQEVNFQHPISQSGPLWLLQRCFSQSSSNQGTVFWSILLISWAPKKNGILFISWAPAVKLWDFFLDTFQSRFDLLLVLQIGLSVFWLSFTHLTTLSQKKKKGRENFSVCRGKRVWFEA